MNEITNMETMDTTVPMDTAQESAGAPESAPAYDPDNWDDIDFSDVTDDDADVTGGRKEEAEEQEPEADHSPEEAAEEPEKAQEEDKPEQAEEREQLFELKHYGQVHKVNRDEVVVLAQKGMDYDNVRTERDISRTKYAELEGFLQELAAPNGWSIEQLMDHTRATVLAEREGIDQGVALQRVQLDRDRKALELQQKQAEAEKQAKSQEDQRINGSFARFVQEYPDVDPKTIPKEVWDEFSQGNDLAGSYARWENKQIKQQLQEAQAKIAAQEQNEKNKERSTGSQQSAGAGETQKKDPIDEDWYSGD